MYVCGNVANNPVKLKKKKSSYSDKPCFVTAVDRTPGGIGDSKIVRS